MSLEAKFLEKVDSLETELVTLTRNMVKIPSANPPGNEEEIASFVADKLRSLGFEVELVESHSKRVNTLGRLVGVGGGKTILYNGHQDTVPVGNLENWSVDPLEGAVKERKIYGRGTGDMKGSIAAAIIAAKALVETDVKLKGDFLIHAVADEETGSKYGTQYLVENGYASSANIDSAVVGEGSVWQDKIYARTAVRGLHWIRIVTKGKAVHGSRPEEGINAVLHMCKILLALNQHTFSSTPHPLLPPPTIAPGTLITGGAKENIIPEMCEAVCDLRAIPGMTSEATLEEVRTVIAQLQEEDPEINAEVSTKFWWPTSEISTSAEVFQLAGKAVKTVTGYELLPRGTSGSNDTAWLTNNAGISAMAFGPGDNYQSGVHGANEWVSIDRLVDFAKIYGLLAMKSCGVE